MLTLPGDMRTPASFARVGLVGKELDVDVKGLMEEVRVRTEIPAGDTHQRHEATGPRTPHL